MVRFTSESSKAVWGDPIKRQKILDAQRIGKTQSLTWHEAVTKNLGINQDRRNLEWRRRLTEAAKAQHDRDRIANGGIVFAPEILEKIRIATVERIWLREATSIELLSQESLLRRDIAFLTDVPLESITRADLLISDSRIAVFCDGCYWHACPVCGFDRLLANRVRDERITRILSERNWTVLRFWEHEIRSDPDIVGRTVEGQLAQSACEQKVIITK